MIPKLLLPGSLAAQAPQMTPATSPTDAAASNSDVQTPAYEVLPGDKTYWGSQKDPRTRADWSRYPVGAWHDDTKINGVMTSTGTPGKGYVFSRKASFANIPEVPMRQDHLFGMQGNGGAQVRIAFHDRVHSAVTIQVLHAHSGVARQCDVVVAYYSSNNKLSTYGKMLSAGWNPVHITDAAVNIVEIVVLNPALGSILLLSQVMYQ